MFTVPMKAPHTHTTPMTSVIQVIVYLSQIQQSHYVVGEHLGGRQQSLGQKPKTARGGFMPDFLFCYADIPSKGISFARVWCSFQTGISTMAGLRVVDFKTVTGAPVYSFWPSSATANRALTGPRLQQHDWSKTNMIERRLKSPSSRLELVCYPSGACLMRETTYRRTHPHSDELTHMQQEMHTVYRHRHLGSRSLRLPLRGKTKTGDERGK